MPQRSRHAIPRFLILLAIAVPLLIVGCGGSSSTPVPSSYPLPSPTGWRSWAGNWTGYYQEREHSGVFNCTVAADGHLTGTADDNQLGKQSIQGTLRDYGNLYISIPAGSAPNPQYEIIGALTPKSPNDTTQYAGSYAGFSTINNVREDGHVGKLGMTQIDTSSHVD